jgi:hypothetical protein
MKRILRENNNTGTSTGAAIFPRTMEPEMHIGQDEAAYNAFLEQQIAEPSTIDLNAWEASNPFESKGNEAASLMPSEFVATKEIVFSSGHGKNKFDGLNANAMNGAFGGKQRVSKHRSIDPSILSMRD